MYLVSYLLFTPHADEAVVYTLYMCAVTASNFVVLDLVVPSIQGIVGAPVGVASMLTASLRRVLAICINLHTFLAIRILPISILRTFLDAHTSAASSP